MVHLARYTSQLQNLNASNVCPTRLRIVGQHRRSQCEGESSSLTLENGAKVLVDRIKRLSWTGRLAVLVRRLLVAERD